MSRQFLTILKNPKFWMIILAIIIIVPFIGLVSNPKNDGPDLSLLHIDNVLSSLATGSDINVETEGGLLVFKPHRDFLELFNHHKWNEKSVASPYESTATLKFKVNEGYYLNLYSYEDYSMVYCANCQGKYRYYRIPDGTYEAIESYVWKNGYPLEEENR